VVVLPNVTMLSREELDAFRAYVAAGGALYASKATSLADTDGVAREDFGLTDVLGVTYRGETEELVTYVAPRREEGALFGEFTARYPMTLHDTQLRVAPQPTAEVLATIVLPYTDPRSTQYASILTNPPGITTDLPAIVRHRYGQGQVIYAAGTLEINEHDSQRAVFVGLLRLLARRPFAFEAAAPKAVEVTLYDDRDRQRLLMNLLNVQRELPNIPIMGVQLRVRLDGRTPRTLSWLPDRQPLTYAVEGDVLTFEAPRLETFLALELSYG
jgi:hypothetical protein